MEKFPQPKDDKIKDENGFSWITSGLYSCNKEENSVESYLEDKITPGRNETLFSDHEWQRQSEPIISKFTSSKFEIPSPKLKHKSNYYSNFERNSEAEQMRLPCRAVMIPDYSFSNSANSPKIRKQYKPTFEKCFVVNLYIETRHSHLGPFPFEIHPKMNVRLLKLKHVKFKQNIQN